VLATFWTFGDSTLPLLPQVAALARTCGAPLLAEADLSLLDEPEAWNEFRASKDAGWLGLMLPRVLLRLPWGAATSPCETIAFEEIAAAPASADLLWGNPAPFGGMLLAQCFERFGWNFRPGDVRQVEDLPIYTWRSGDDLRTFYSAETEMSDETAEVLVDNGIMPVRPDRGGGRVHVPWLLSAATGSQPLRGRWLSRGH
jgi:type VI secretion system protein ImpC